MDSDQDHDLEAFGRRLDSIEGRQSDLANSLAELAHSVVDLHRQLADLKVIPPR